MRKTVFITSEKPHLEIVYNSALCLAQSVYHAFILLSFVNDIFQKSLYLIVNQRRL
jgi:hypothetical protein